MKFFIYIVFTLLSIQAILANNTSTLNITVKEVDSKTGTMYLTICPKDVFIQTEEKRDYSKCPARLTKQIDAEEKYNFTFNNIAFSEWVVFGYIDENDNGTLDYSDMGIPKEPVLFTVQLKREPIFNDVKTIVNKINQNIILFAQ